MRFWLAGFFVAMSLACCNGPGRRPLPRMDEAFMEAAILPPPYDPTQARRDSLASDSAKKIRYLADSIAAQIAEFARLRADTAKGASATDSLRTGMDSLPRPRPVPRRRRLIRLPDIKPIPDSLF